MGWTNVGQNVGHLLLTPPCQVAFLGDPDGVVFDEIIYPSGRCLGRHLELLGEQFSDSVLGSVSLLDDFPDAGKGDLCLVASN